MVSLLLDERDITDAPALPCTFLAHHEPESVYNIIALIITVVLIIMLSSIPTCPYSSDNHPYTGNLDPGTPGDSKNALLHWGDVVDHHHLLHSVFCGFDCFF